MEITQTTITNILTRSSGYLRPVASHSLQPYQGCALGNSLCGVGCYVQHNAWLTRGRRWGAFVEVRTNAAESYRRQYEAERAWGRRTRGEFCIFMSSSTDPFQPVERRFGITRQVMEAMVAQPPDALIVQSHSHHAADYLELYQRLAAVCRLRFHLSIEADQDRLPGLPPPASSVAQRIAAAGRLKSAGLRTVVTLAPLGPVADPDAFFARLAEVADAVVIDHFIGGDGSVGGGRTRRTALPLAMQQVNERSVSRAYQEEMVAVARRYFPGAVGVNADGFAGRMLSHDAGAPGAAAAGDLPPAAAARQ